MQRAQKIENRRLENTKGQVPLPGDLAFHLPERTTGIEPA